ncbi:unnamed protein product [Rhizoctonia solani]|uniref:Myb-like domain-containing protein n=1 Tax=Rhizoctonia solani TaxID=456999 RepID=A0A8H2WNJ5_9AGAM|nr:unnamed protein product [Rhizoctonia solani]CAE6509799.1 unnamed protein product [Rhizoctonia solani]
MSHRRSTSDSTAPIFTAHGLQFAGQGEEEDRYNAAQRYDWDDVPPKLIEPRAPYDATQPFDYAVPKKIKVLGSSENLVAGVRRSTRSRKDENTPVVSESEIARQLSKKRGRPRRSEASRKTDDGDNTEDESYMEPASGTKRRSQHQPAKRARVSRNDESARREETDEEQEQDTAPLRSGGARSRVTPLKPQQANRWSNTEDRQLIDSLFDVIGSIPWRRVTAYMAEKGYTCADRGEGAIRGRWKVLRPRLYIVPPPVVRGAAAKSQLKAKEKETTEPEAEAEHEEKETEVEHEDKEGEQEDEEGEQGDKEREERDVERAGREAAEQAARDIEDELDAVEARGKEEGDTTVEEDDPPAPRRERARGTGPPKRPRERGSERQRDREPEREREINQGPPTPPRIPTPPTLHPPTISNPGSSGRSPVPMSPNPNRRTLPSLQSPERTNERSLPLPVLAVNQRSPRLAGTHSPGLPGPPTPPQTGTLLAPMLASMPGGGWDREREGWVETSQERGLANPHANLLGPHTSPGRMHPMLPEHHQREYPPHPPTVAHPLPPDQHPTRKPRKPEMHPFRTSVAGPWTQNQAPVGQGGYQATTAGQSGYPGQGGYQAPTSGQGGYQAPPTGPGGSFQTLTGSYQPQAYNPVSGQTYQSPPQTFQPAISPGRVYQTSPRQTYVQTSPNQVYHSPSRQVYQSLPGQPYHSPPSQAYHALSPPRQPYHPHPSSYQGPAAQVFPPPPLYVPPPTTFPIESPSPSRSTFQESPTFSGGSPSRLPMLGERGGIGEGGREWDRME